MQISNYTEIINFLDILGFNSKEGTENIYSKTYKNDYEIKITIDESNPSASKIDYGRIKKDRGTTINFYQQENLVVLECVNRLLMKGYPPENIILEKEWKLGHKEKGNLDIQVTDSKDKSFLMIECKTFGDEYNKEISNMRNDGGQLFSYYTQDKDTKYLCLYTSDIENKKVLYKNSIVKITKEIKSSQNRQEAFENWKPQVFEEKGIFEEDISPYIIEFKGLLKSDLEPLTKQDGGSIFNNFAEILRRNVVSDKTNAYNKIFNLFLCKIVDEYERNDNDELEFQWKENETNEDVLLRLNNLYKRGMERYLDLKISSVDLEEITDYLNTIRSEEDKDNIRHLFIQQKLYTSNEFAFKEVFDKNTFDLNCIVVKEVVKLLEKKQIRYATKQQFLGDFFEKLLNTGIKQEAGQFFTPVPIAQFMSKSLPILEIIRKRNNQEEIHILPYVIDYASGAGHFLTEIMSEINYYIENIIDNNFIKNGRTKKEYISYKNTYNWAKEYVYGIEKDYRLAKTTKISTFLNGDGDATIICGDGLDNFCKSSDYKKLLKSDKNEKILGNFDIVISNPPYSVSGFKTTLRDGKESFDLFNKLSDKSKEIECLFVERTNQLLREGGCAAIILPSSILSNTGLYTKAREIILDNFEIKGLVKLGTNTFMATGINTVIFFLKKIKNEGESLRAILEKSIKEKSDLTINKIEKPISKYLNEVYKIEFKDFITLLENNPNEKIKSLEIFSDYEKLFYENNGTKKFMNKKEFTILSQEDKKNILNKKMYEFIIASEKEKLLYFIKSYNKYVVISNIPESRRDEMKFLGYKFSERRGHEGINIFNLGGKLYNPKELNDPSKINYYILKNFLEDVPPKVDERASATRILRLTEIFNFQKAGFEKELNINAKHYLKFKKNLEMPRLGDKLSIKIGGTPTTTNQKYFEGKNLWVSISDMSGQIIYNTKKKLTDEGVKNSNCKLIKKGTTLLSFKLSIGKTAIAGEDLYTNEAIAGLEIKPQFKDKTKDNYIFDKYLYYFFSSEFAKYLLTKNTNIFGTSLNSSFLENLRIPFPDKNTQEDLIIKLQSIDNKIEELTKEINLNQKNIRDFFQNGQDNVPKTKLGVLISENNLISGKRPRGGVDENEEGVISLGGENIDLGGKLNIEDPKYVPDDFYEENKTFQVNSNDILMCKDGAQTGKVALVEDNIEGALLVNEHLFIIRADDNKLKQKYLFYFLYSVTGQNEIKEAIRNKTGQEGLGRKDIFNIEVPCPEPIKQKEVISQIQSFEEKIETAKSTILKFKNDKEKLLSSYLLEE